MNTDSALETVEYLRNNCNGADKWTFLVTDDYGTPVNLFGKNGPLANALLLRKNGPGNFDEYIDDCLKNSSDEATELIKEFVDEYLEFKEVKIINSCNFFK